LINQLKKEKSSKLKSKNLIIYCYSVSNNFLKEVLSKIGVKFCLTNDITKASLILGLKNHLKKNLKLKNLAKKKKIPIYSLNKISLYQLTKFIKMIQ
jgi:tRNA G18 (ribose-2'-O)-methylase SpoU